MSVITGMVLYTSNTETRAMDQLNDWCSDKDTERNQQFRCLDVSSAGGTKFFTGEVWAMASNHFPYVHELIEAMPTFDWEYPEDIVFLYKLEDAPACIFKLKNEEFMSSVVDKSKQE